MAVIEVMRPGTIYQKFLEFIDTVLIEYNYNIA